MKQEQLKKLHDAWWYCDENDKSTEFMLSYMSDISGLEYEEIVDFVTHTSFNERLKYRNSNLPSSEQYKSDVGGSNLEGFYADAEFKNDKGDLIKKRGKILKYVRYKKRSKNNYLIEFSKHHKRYIKFSKLSNISNQY